jgi:hypothetical protein
LGYTPAREISESDLALSYGKYVYGGGWISKDGALTVREVQEWVAADLASSNR